MNLVSAILDYWRSGGPLLLPLAGICFGIWWYFLATRAKLRAALRAPGSVTFSGLKAYDEFERSWLSPLSRDLVVLGALTGAAPLVGLLGTVTGMIATFQAVAASTGETAGDVASGISQALITTQFGLVIAIPGVFGLARLYRLLDQVQIGFATRRSQLSLEASRS